MEVFTPDLLRCREGLYRTGNSIAPAVGLHRVHRVVVSRPRLQVVHANAEHRIGMGRVQPDVRFGRLAQVLGIRAVVYNAKVLGRAPRVVGCPPNNGQIFAGRFELWSLEDADVRGFLGSGNELSRGWT